MPLNDAQLGGYVNARLLGVFVASQNIQSMRHKLRNVSPVRHKPVASRLRAFA
jgi:hypothetical protein